MNAYLILILAAAGLAATTVVYGQKNYTLPGYAGGGRWGLLIGTFLGGIGLVWLIGKLTGVSIISGTSASLAFALKYDDSQVVMGGWLLLIGFLSVMLVAAINTVRYGKATM